MQHEMQDPPVAGYTDPRSQSRTAYRGYGDKLGESRIVSMPSAGQRLTLAIVSLGMFIVLVFGVFILSVLANAPNWAVIPIMLIFFLFSGVAVLINFFFNRSA